MVRSTWISAASAGLALALLLTACSSNQKASNRNFTLGLNEYYAAHDDCLYRSALRFPYEVSVSEQGGARAKEMDALTAAGLLQRTEEKSIHVRRYSLTPYAMARANARFCYGHRQVTAIDSFTPPAAVNGQRTSQVVYEYKMMDVPGWAQSEQMRAAFPALAKTTASQTQDKAQMVLTAAGWRVPE